MPRYLNSKGGCAYANRYSRFQNGGFADPLAIDNCAVGAVQIVDDPAAVTPESGATLAWCEETNSSSRTMVFDAARPNVIA
jgi:hypothetical protein